MQTKVSCPMCHLMFKTLTQHIIKKHKMSISDFRKLFPNQELVSEATRKLQSESSVLSGCGKWNKNRKLSNNHKKKISLATSGENNPFYGKRHLEITKEKMSKNHANFEGDLNPYRIAMKDDDYKANDRAKRLAYYESRRQENSDNYRQVCDAISIRVANLHVIGKLKSYGRGHKYENCFSQKANKFLYCRSSYEIEFVKLCDLDDRVISLDSWRGNILYKDDRDHARRYIPDFVVNSQIIVEIKAEFALSDDLTCRKLAAGLAYCVEQNMRFVCLTDVKRDFDSIFEDL